MARATVTLLVILSTTVTAWAEDWPEYITDVVLAGGTASEATSVKNSSTYSGYTWCSTSLNDGTKGDVIYIGYKKGSRANVNGGYITDFIVVETGSSHNPSSTFSLNGITYYLCPYAGGNTFANDRHGNLTSQVSKAKNLYLYYTKANFSDKRAVSGITITSGSSESSASKSGAINCYYTNGNLFENEIDLNKGAGCGTYVYMHINTVTKTNRPSADPVMASGLVYNGSAKQLIATGATMATGTMYYSLGTSGSETSTAADVKATTPGTYTVYYYAASNDYGNQSETHSTTVSIASAPNSGVTVSCADIVEGNTLTPQLGGTNLSTGAVTYKYCTTPDGDYTTTAPTAHGTYYVKATVAADGNCNAFTTAAATFTIHPDWALHNSGDSEDDPYIISSPEQLLLLAQRVNTGTGTDSGEGIMYRKKFFKVTENITFTHSTEWDDATSTENNYQSIGGARIGTIRYSFAGTFDGGGHTIKGIRIYQPDNDIQYHGLFGDTSDDAVVKNISLSDTRITAHSGGGIVGSNSGTVINCAVGSNVSIVGKEFADQYHGGVVGNNHGTIEGCRSLAKLTYNGSSSIFWGAIAGGNSGTLKNNLAYSATVNNQNSGAIVGIQEGGTLISNYYYNCTIDGVKNASNVGVTYQDITLKRSDVDGARKGVLIGASPNNITIQPTGDATFYDVSKITGYEGNNVIKFLTLFFSGDTETVSLDLSYSNANGNAAIYYDGNNNKLPRVGGNTYTYTMSNQALSITAKLFPDWAQKNSGDTEGDAYIISTTDQLDLLAQRVNDGNDYSGKFFKLGDNIAFDKSKENNFTPIGTESMPFSGNFDGNGMTISGLNINLSSTNFVGLFGYASGADIKNLILVNSSIVGKDKVGGIAGYAGSNTKVVDCAVTSDVSVTGTYYAGGISGMSGIISGCNSAAAVSASYYAGGIVSFINGNFSNSVDHCIYSGNTVTGSNSGAIVGVNDNNATMTSNYYSSDLAVNGCNGSDINGARQALTISAGTDVTLTPKGTPSTYDVSGITVYAGNSGILYNDGTTETLYAGATEAVMLTLAYNGSGTVPEGYILGYSDGNGNAISGNATDGYTLTMPAAVVTVSATYVPDFATYWNADADHDGSTATKAYIITTTTGLNLLAQRVNAGNDYKNKFFKLGDNITYDGTENNFTRIGNNSLYCSFNGTFDGDGKSISGININSGDADYQGIFGLVDGTVKNLVVSNCRIVGRLRVGVIAGVLRCGTIEN